MRSACRTLLLSQQDVARLIGVRQVIPVVREAFKAMARGQAVMPSKLYLPLPGGNDFRAMPAFLRRPPACGMKWVNVHPRNAERGLPTVMAVIVLNHVETGVPLAIMDGQLITKLRTASAAAVAAETLARPDSRVVGLIGCGAQADAQVEALTAVRPIARVNVWGHRATEAQRFCRDLRRRLPNVQCQPESTIEACVRDADIVVTVTPSRRPLVQRRWIAPGTHINAIGADAPGKQELDHRILQEATVVVDERQQAIHGGELNVPIRRRQFRAAEIHADLGQILLGRRVGRRSPQELTVFDSTGLAVHDIAVAAEVFRQARRRRVGHDVALCSSSVRPHPPRVDDRRGLR